MKISLQDYTEQEFLEFVRKIFNSDFSTEALEDEAMSEFERLTEHPDGSDVICYPKPSQKDSPEGVLEIVKEWRKANGKPGFKADEDEDEDESDDR